MEDWASAIKSKKLCIFSLDYYSTAIDLRLLFLSNVGTRPSNFLIAKMQNPFYVLLGITTFLSLAT